MDTRIRLRKDAHERVDTVFKEHDADLKKNAPGGLKHVATVDATVSDVKRLLTEQAQHLTDRRTAIADGREERRALRNAVRLVVAVNPLVRLADGTAKLLQTPQVSTDDDLLRDCGAILETAQQHADAYVAEGVPAGLLDNLAKHIEAFGDTRKRLAVATQGNSAARLAILDRLADADEAIGVVHAILINTPDANPDVLRKLRQAKRVGPRVHEDAAAQPPATTTPPAPTSPITPTKVA